MMANIIDLDKYREIKMQKKNQELDEISYQLNNIDTDAIFRRIFPDRKQDTKLDTSFLQKYDEEKVNNVFSAMAKASAIISQSNPDWGK